MAFVNSPYGNATLHVPASLLKMYKRTPPWKYFGRIVPFTLIHDGSNSYDIADGNAKLQSGDDPSSSEVIIPEDITRDGNTFTVTVICKWAFKGYSNLTDVYCLAEEVSETDPEAFIDSPIEDATLHVPAGSVEAYRTTAPWSRFGTIVALMEDEVDYLLIKDKII